MPSNYGQMRIPREDTMTVCEAQNSGGLDKAIQITNATEGPLDGVDLEIEYEKMYCFLGPAGSGARTMATKVLCGESRRRYMLALSPLERENMGGVSQVRVGSVEGIPPAQWVGDVDGGQNVGAFLQLEAPMAQLARRQGTIRCSRCGGICLSFTVAEAVETLLADYTGQRLLFVGSLALEDPAALDLLVAELLRAGYRRVLQDGEVQRLEDGQIPQLREGNLDVVVDRLEAVERNRSRLTEAFGGARAVGRGGCLVIDSEQRRIALNHMPTCQQCNQTSDIPRPGDYIPGKGKLDIEWQGRSLQEWSSQSLSVMSAVLASQTDADSSELLRRLQSAIALGLGPVKWGQTLGALASGQVRRLQLAACLNQELVGVLYVFECPTLALSQDQKRPVIDGLEELVRQGNTVIALDHSPDLIDRAAKVVAFEAGRIKNTSSDVAPSEAATSVDSLAPRRWRQTRQLNLIDGVRQLSLPLEGVVMLQGGSGVGKSWLWHQVLEPMINKSKTSIEIATSEGERLAQFQLESLQGIGRALACKAPVEVLGKKRKTVAEWLNVDQPIARILSGSPVATGRKIPAEWFALRRAGGRCPACEGSGVFRQEMHFLEDIELECPQCNGRRFRDEILEVTFKGRSIGDIYSMTVQQAAEYFARETAVLRKMQRAMECGLGHCVLGQLEFQLEPFQRLMLEVAVEWPRLGKSDIVFFDNPIAGGHDDDLALLVGVLRTLSDNGASVLVAGQDPRLAVAVDWVIELAGPEPGRLPRASFAGPWNAA